MKKVIGLALVGFFYLWQCSPGYAKVQFKVSFDGAVHSGPITGRVILILTRSDHPEPRFQVSPNGVPIFGINAEELSAGQAAIIDQTTPGHPVDSLQQLPAGDYYVQAVLNVYTKCKRSDGHTVWVHLDKGGGESFNTWSGNLYSNVRKVHLDPATGYDIEILLNHKIPPEDPLKDTRWLKHVRIQSKLLSEFWGQPIYLGATVLLPKGYDEHPDVRYPVVYPQGYIGTPAFYFNDDPKSLKEEEGLRRTGVQPGYEFFQSWNSEKFPRFLAVTFIDPTPFFPDAYGVNSANDGPYGDAIIRELIPYIEEHFRAIGKGYARILEGASTGGWGSLALQLQHPDFFGGAWIFYPDPIDFRRYQLVNIYEDENAFLAPGRSWVPAERPFRRTDEGQMAWTNRHLSQFEAVLGDKRRSGFQLNGWEAIYGPVGEDGYPRPLWDPRTGKIDHQVALYMRDHGYDLRYFAEKNWPRLGPQLAGKLHFICGDMDNFYLNLAVYLYEDFAKSTTNPHSDATFEYGRPLKGHWWHPKNFADMLRDMAKQVAANAPDGESKAWLED